MDHHRLATHSDDEGEGLADFKQRHHCTDIPCCVIFLVSLLFLGGIYAWACKEGGLARLYHGIQFDGKICGIDENVEEKPYLAWCVEASSVPGNKPAIRQPICIAACPGDGTGGTQVGMAESAECPVGTYSPQDTKVYMNRYCVPRAKTYTEATEVAVEAEAGTMEGRFTASLSSIPAAWPVLVGIFFLAFLLGFAYLAVLRHFAEVMVWACVVISVVGLVVLGSFLWSHASTRSEDLPESQDLPEEFQQQEEMATKVIAVLCWALAIVLAAVACCLHSSIEGAIACVEAACEAIWEMPSLLLAPALKTLVEGILCAALCFGFLQLWSCGDITRADDGVHRSLHHTQDQWAVIIYYCLVSFWITAFINALYQFLLAYAVVIFYLSPSDEDGEKDVNGFHAAAEGLTVGLLRHPGSLALGSLLIAVLQLLGKVIEYLKAKNKEAGHNAVVGCILRMLGCCVACCKDTIEHVNKFAYIDIAYTSREFCAAAQSALELMARRGAQMALLKGATYLFMVFGCTLITVLCWTAAYLACGVGPWATEVVDPIPVAVVGALEALLVALSFMHIFDTVSDTLLYCFARPEHEEKPTPNAFKKLENEYLNPHS